MVTTPATGPAHQPTPAATDKPTAPVRRVLSGDDLRAVHAAASAATNPAQLLRDSFAALAAALHAPGIAPEATDPDPTVSVPAGYAIPASQWDAVFGVITGRAHVWGLAGEIGLDLALNLMPAAYDDPEPLPDSPVLADLRPGEHHLTLTRDAVEVIAACQAHLQRLRDCYHPAAPAYRHAADSWHDLLTVLLTAHPDARVSSHGHLGLSVESSGGPTWALTYQQAVRRCTTTGCRAVIDDHGEARAPSPEATVLDHDHVLSYPLDGPALGGWTATY